MKRKEPLTEKIIQRQLIFQGKYLHLERLELLLPNQNIAKREIVRVRDAVGILPIDRENAVYLVRQHRPAIESTIIEIPAGLIDEGEELEEAARRECEEETGYRPRKVKKLIAYAHAEGYSTGFITLFLGTDLEHTGKINLDITEYLNQVILPFHDLYRMVEQNRIIDSKTILSTLYCKKFLDNLSINL